MSLRIATFNLENLDDRPGEAPALDDRIRLLRPELDRLEADILCLQEINAQEAAGHERTLTALDRLLAGSRYAGFHRAVTTNDRGTAYRDVHNLVTLSRFPITTTRQVRHDLVTGPDYNLATAEGGADGPRRITWDRPVLVTEIDIGGPAPLHVINLHLKAPLASHIPGQKAGPFAWRSVPGWAEGYFIAAIKRSGQALETRLLIDQLFDRDGDARIVVGGDFNAESREVPLVIIRGDVDEVGNGKLAYRALVPVERTVPPDQRFTVRHLGEKVMLDHLLISRALLGSFRRAEVHNETLTDELAAYYADRKDAESFHAPVVATFALPSTG